MSESDDPNTFSASTNDEEEDATRQRRVEALSELARQAQGAPASTPAPSPTLPIRTAPPEVPRTPRAHGRRLWLAVGAAVLCLAVIAAVVANMGTFSHGTAKRQPSPTATPVPALEILPSTVGLECPHDLAWSPSGKELAIVGYRGDCPTPDTLAGLTHSCCVPGLVAVYDGTSGALAASLQPDNMIISAIKLPVELLADAALLQEKVDSLLQVDYTHVLWSPDGKRLALTFRLPVWDGKLGGTPPTPITPPTSTYGGTVLDGVLLVNPDGSQPQVLTHPAGKYSAIEGGADLPSVSQPVSAYVDWNLSQGMTLPVTPPTPAPTQLVTALPALAYQWGAGGVLSLVTPLSSTSMPQAPPMAPVGNPDGGTSFTIWQPGVASAEIAGALGQPPLNQGVYTWSTDIAAWSSDGQHLVEHLVLNGLFVSRQVSRPSSQDLAPYSWSDVPSVPVRDAGVVAALGMALHSPFASPYIQGVLLAWRPDGRALAVASAAGGHSVSLFSCASGNRLANLAPATKGGTPGHESGEADVLHWSPDGSRLAFFDPNVGTLTIWHAAP